MLGVDVAVIYYACTTIKMRNVRYLVASKTVMWYNCFIKKENIFLYLCNDVPLLIKLSALAERS